MDDTGHELRLASDRAEQYLLDRVLNAEGAIIGWARAGAPGGREEADRLIDAFDETRRAWERFGSQTTNRAARAAEV